MKNTYLEFNDSEDPESNAYKKEERTSFKITVEPQMYLLAMIDEPKAVHSDVLPAVKKLMQVAYYQGKEVGKLVSSSNSKK